MSEAREISSIHNVEIKEVSALMKVSCPSLRAWAVNRPNLFLAAVQFTEEHLGRKDYTASPPKRECYRGYSLCKKAKEDLYRVYKDGKPISRSKMTYSEAKKAVDSRLI